MHSEFIGFNLPPVSLKTPRSQSQKEPIFNSGGGTSVNKVLYIVKPFQLFSSQKKLKNSSLRTQRLHCALGVKQGQGSRQARKAITQVK